jgi:hypothetical protein
LFCTPTFKMVAPPMDSLQIGLGRQLQNKNAELMITH